MTFYLSLTYNRTRKPLTVKINALTSVKQSCHIDGFSGDGIHIDASKLSEPHFVPVVFQCSTLAIFRKF